MLMEKYGQYDDGDEQNKDRMLCLSNQHHHTYKC